MIFHHLNYLKIRLNKVKLWVFSMLWGDLRFFGFLGGRYVVRTYFYRVLYEDTFHPKPSKLLIFHPSSLLTPLSLH